jgi:hypothetical protein
MNTVKTQQKKDIKRNRGTNSIVEMATFKEIVFSSDSILFHISDNPIITTPLAWV